MFGLQLHLLLKSCIII